MSSNQPHAAEPPLNSFHPDLAALLRASPEELRADILRGLVFAYGADPSSVARWFDEPQARLLGSMTVPQLRLLIRQALCSSPDVSS